LVLLSNSAQIFLKTNCKLVDIFLNIQIPSGIAATNQKDRKIIRKVALLQLPLTHDLEILDPESAIFAPKMSSNNLSRRQCL